LERFREIGVGSVIVIPFTKEFAKTSPQQFIHDVLVEKVGIRKIISGHDHLFGKGRQGDFLLLKQAGEQYGFEVEQMPEFSPSGTVVSSTAIRQALLEGRIADANSFLGYSYSITGEVIHGNQIGKQIHFPTANIKPNYAHKLIPANGVYTSLVKWKDNVYKGMSNIGFRPTINGHQLTVEVNIFEFSEDIYSETIILSFISRIRDEIKFSGLSELEAQLRHDKETALKLLSE
jgi:riboflavin kinase / FMN adenylyltransferase